MADRDQQRVMLEEQLAETEAELDGYHVEANSWNLRVGPLIVTRVLTSQGLLKIFVSFHIVLGAFGALLILRGRERVADLGIALVVGSLFALGSFLAEVWVQTVDRGHAIRRQQREMRVAELLDRGMKLRRQIAAIEEDIPASDAESGDVDARRP